MHPALPRSIFQPPGHTLPRWLLPAMLLLAGVYTHWLVFQWGPPGWQKWTSDWVFLLPLVPTVALCWYSAMQQQGRARLGWAFVALAVSCYSVGELVWTYIELFLKKEPFPSLADAFYLGFTPALVLAFLLFPRAPFRPMEALRLGLDVAVIIAAAGVYAWYFMFAPTILAYPGQQLTMAIALAYPIGDLILLSLLLLIALRPHAGPLTLETWLLGVGLISMITADLFFFFGTSSGTFSNSKWYNGGWIWAQVLLTLATYSSLFPPRAAAKPQRRAWHWPRLYVPYIAVAASYALLMTRAFSGTTLANSGVQWGTALVTLLVIVRQIVALNENTRLTNKLQAYSDQLQQTNQALSEAKEKAEVANRAKSAFLASMSHELRTPLNAVLGYAQILQRDHNLSERQLLGLATIQSSGQHLLTLINDLLDLSKVEAGKLELSPNPVHLADFLAIVADIISVKAEKKSLRFQLEAAPDLPTAVLMDEKRLRQVLLNLLSNAVKFTDRGQVTLRVSQQHRNGEQAGLRFEVADSGVGIAPEQQTAIFQPFEQVGEQARRSGGTGLGLAISQQLLHLMGSRIEVASIPGQGSRFWFEISLPLAEAQRANQAQHTIAGYDGPRRTVLVVDDVVANRALAMDLLGDLGFSLLEAENGEVALRQAEQAAPDLILTDMVMPVLDGLETTRRVRAHPTLHAVPIIIVSASATAEDQVDAMAAGANAFITKPIDQQELLQEIGSLLHLSWRYAAAPAEAAAPPEKPAVLLPPPVEELTVLHQLAMAGNLSELRLRAGHLATLDPGYRPFAEQLAQLAEDFKSKAVLRLIESHLSGET